MAREPRERVGQPVKRAREGEQESESRFQCNRSKEVPVSQCKEKEGHRVSRSLRQDSRSQEENCTRKSTRSPLNCTARDEGMCVGMRVGRGAIDSREHEGTPTALKGLHDFLSSALSLSS